MMLESASSRVVPSVLLLELPIDCNEQREADSLQELPGCRVAKLLPRYVWAEDYEQNGLLPERSTAGDHEICSRVRSKAKWQSLRGAQATHCRGVAGPWRGELRHKHRFRFTEQSLS